MTGDAAIAPREASRKMIIRTVWCCLGDATTPTWQGANCLVDAPPVRRRFLLHGWTATADLNWYSSYSALKANGLVALDHRGHGRDIRSRPHFDLPTAPMMPWLFWMSWVSVIAVGYSMGGPIAQLIWRRHPVVMGLVLCATTASFSTTKQTTCVRAIVLAQAARVIPTLRQLIGSQLLTGKSGKDLRQWAVGSTSSRPVKTDSGWAPNRAVR